MGNAIVFVFNDLFIVVVASITLQMFEIHFIHLQSVSIKNDKPNALKQKLQIHKTQSIHINK